MNDRTAIRLGLAVILLVAGGYNAAAWATNDTRVSAETYYEQAQLPPEDRSQIVPSRDNATVVTTRGAQSAIGTDALYVFGPDGRLLYLENRTRYADIDPHPTGRHDLLVAADRRGGDACSACSTQYIRVINYSTGETRDVFTYNTPTDRDSNWHDVDYLGEHRYAIAGIWHDRLWVYNTSSHTTTFSWNLQFEFNTTSAGPYPGDWAHLNDVEQLPDGRYMISPRNHDQILFIHPEKGLQEEWTIGCDDCFDTLYEQHNPDYIPPSHGGPAVLIADSENNRIVEYQRRDGEWVESWVWQDDRLDWPRDADRLPNGHTLITDTHGNRVLEVDRDGDIVWEIHAPNGYEAERLGTGDESQGGPSAVRAGLESHTSNATTAASYTYANEAEWGRLAKLKHGLLFLTPSWMRIWELLFTLFASITMTAWLLVELRWRGLRWRLPATITSTEDDTR